VALVDTTVGIAIKPHAPLLHDEHDFERLAGIDAKLIA
jgi:hypothetical protein